jgi:hypothetical protein
MLSAGGARRTLCSAHSMTPHSTFAYKSQPHLHRRPPTRRGAAEFSAGTPGDPAKPARVIKVRMFEGGGKMASNRRESKSAEGNRD